MSTSVQFSPSDLCSAQARSFPPTDRQLASLVQIFITTREVGVCFDLQNSDRVSPDWRAAKICKMCSASLLGHRILQGRYLICLSVALTMDGSHVSAARWPMRCHQFAFLILAPPRHIMSLFKKDKDGYAQDNRSTHELIDWMLQDLIILTGTGARMGR